MIILSSLFFYTNLFGQQDDSIKIYYLDEVNVYAKKLHLSGSEFPVEKDNLGSVLELGGFSIIRKGIFLAQDVYADGLKKGDIPIVVDGERYHNACPMRMDAPISRVNPLEIESIELSKTSNNLQSGLGGIVSINRSTPGNNFSFKGSATHITGNLQATDLTLLAEKYNNRISFRYAEGTPYKNGDGKSYKDLYQYKDNTKFVFGETSFNGIADDWEYSASFMYSGDISFPYLQMDERKSKVYNGSISYKNFKLYMNYTDHLMDNGLRISNMSMHTDAKNFTLGLTSDFFEIFYRYWNADNTIVPANPMMQTINNNLLPEINLYSGRIQHRLNLAGFNISGKLGIAYYHLGNENSLKFISTVHNSAENNIVFPTAGFSISNAIFFAEKFVLSGMIDFSAEAPEAEMLFVNVRKMMNKPWWVGNPTLNQPMRTTLRTSLSSELFDLELFGSYIINYDYLDQITVGMQKYQTYSDIDALIAGARFNLSYSLFELNASYTYGNNETDNSPLIEIVPLQVISKLSTPKLFNIKIYLKHTYQNAQARVDERLFETKSRTWNRFDVGLTGKFENIIYSLDIENILNLSYNKHLSYVRDPFSSKYTVYEPGINVRVNFRYYTE
jgi:outer membrane receptor protein involved in Fe transport